jgi:hypothetical protein
VNNASSDCETSSFDHAMLVNAGANSITGGRSASGGICGVDRHGVGEDLLPGLPDAMVLPRMAGRLLHDLVVGAAGRPTTETGDFL